MASLFETKLAETAAAVQVRLDQLLPMVDGPEAQVVAAMRLACLAGGKRLRPFLVAESSALFQVPRERALTVGAAVEMLHSYSLVHDDLPAMDDSDLRRGQPTLHKTYDEATAILAGDGLLTEAFQVLASPESHPDPAIRIELTAALARAAGAAGMVGGQMIDVAADRGALRLDLPGITRLQALKTGALMGFSVMAGAILGCAGKPERTALEDYAADLGLAFQIRDDLLDCEGTASELGKPVGQDKTLQKATFVSLLGAEEARKKAALLVDSAVARLDIFAEKADLLRQAALFVLERRL
ncbi:polyprenyl synthetase family protein [Limibacillus halophilus]|uniref:Farnesyl diphosphate synthase n=1 Tax=Limibacillus halophilus TaxID=1579333 RepID=A0A839SRI8_9PROT|nr:farnesyl diphosphate synthase [Limibacillus halophilus]MBB3065102.1 farnesyl diphosphate synthase [Limibacillus halophilus]